MSIPDLRVIQNHLGDCAWNVQVFEEVGSTNTIFSLTAISASAM